MSILDYDKNYEKLKEKYKKQILRELQKDEIQEMKKELHDRRIDNTLIGRRLQKMTTSKFIMYLILLNCTVIEVYSMIVMVKLNDLSPLMTLIGSVVGESISYAIYCAKSFNSTKSEEDLKFAKQQFLINSGLEDEVIEDFPDEVINNEEEEKQ